jgi:hypothetical protein
MGSVLQDVGNGESSQLLLETEITRATCCQDGRSEELLDAK